MAYFFIIIIVGGIAVFFALIISLARYIFRINDIADSLQNIYKLLTVIQQSIVITAGAKVKCDICGLSFPKDAMKPLDSGQNLCPDCLNKFKTTD